MKIETPEQELMKASRTASRSALIDSDTTCQLVAQSAFEVAARRTAASRDALYSVWQEYYKDEPVKSDAYELAIDELDKIVFAMRTMAELPKARERWVDGVYQNARS